MSKSSIDLQNFFPKNQLKVVDILEQMGACVEKNGDKVRVKSEALHGIQIDASDIPDLIPVLSVTAAHAKKGVTIVTNAERLRLKESDRLQAICESLTLMGNVNAQTDDGLVIWCDEKITGGEVPSYSDHRMAMAFTLVGLKTGKITIKNPGCCRKTFENYFEIIDQFFR